MTAPVPTPAPAPLDLADIHLPPDPSWWPPAPGWWIVALLGLALAILAARFARQRLRARRWRRRIDDELTRIVERHRADGDDARLLADVSRLLRQVTHLLDPRAAALTGADWLAFLDARGGGDAFTHGAGRVLASAPWQRAPQVDAPALAAAARHWLAHALPRSPRHA